MKKLVALAAVIAAILVAAPSGAQTSDPSTIRVDFYEGKTLRSTNYLSQVPEIDDRVTVAGGTYSVAARRFIIGSRVVIGMAP